MNKEQLQEIIKSIQTLMRCPNCGAHYNLGGISVLGQIDNTTCLVDLECNQCGMPVRVIANVAVHHQNKELSEVQNRIKETKITNGEESEISSDKKVTVDDVIELHRFLEKFDGDFKSLFEDKDKE